MLQLREKRLDDRDLFDLAHAVRRAFAGTLLINGRLDVAVAVRADGVHLPSTGLEPTVLREASTDLLLGASLHQLDELTDERLNALDYLTFSPVFDTPSKRRFGRPQGLTRLRHACNRSSRPVFALGGITAETLESIAGAGAYGAAAIRLFAESESSRQALVWARSRLG